MTAVCGELIAALVAACTDSPTTDPVEVEAIALALHAEAVILAGDADQLARRGRGGEARALYRLAAELALRALGNVRDDHQRVLGVISVAAVTLLIKAELIDAAEQLAHRMLAGADLLPVARDQMRGLLRMLLAMRAHAEGSSC